MKRRVAVAVTSALLCLALALPAGAQDIAQMLQEKSAAIAMAVAINQESLHKYTWVETVDIAHSGEVKDQKVYNCRYAPDGTVQKTELSDTPEGHKTRGLLRKAIAGEVAKDIKDYMQRAVTLIKEYVPPSAEKLKGSVAAGHASISQKGPDALQLQFDNYVKNGDSVQLVVNKEAKKIRTMMVNTSLDTDGDKDPVTLTVDFEVLPDGTSYPAKKVLNAPAKKMTVTITDQDYQMLAN